MKHQLFKFSTLALLSVCSPIVWAAGELSCKKSVAINETEGWKRTCTYQGSSLNDAYQTYREVMNNLQEAPETLPSQNRKFKFDYDEDNKGEVVVKWHGKNSVSVMQEYTSLGGGSEVSFKKLGNQIQIQELGWTP